MSEKDLVVGVLEPYENSFTLWRLGGRTLQQGDPVPQVGLADTYAVLLRGPREGKKVYLWVQEGVITNTMALQPINDRSVFDPQGHYLGRGGDKLISPPTSSRMKPQGLVETVLQQQKQPTPQKVFLEAVESKSVHELVTELQKPEEPPAATLVHKFYLRPDFLVGIELPANLSEREAERLSEFVSTIPFR